MRSIPMNPVEPGSIVSKSGCNFLSILVQCRHSWHGGSLDLQNIAWENSWESPIVPAVAGPINMYA